MKISEAFPHHQLVGNERKVKWEADQELSKRTEPIRDAIYKEHLSAVSIKRYDRNTEDKEFILDTTYHIDCIIDTGSSKITLQEKGLRNKFATFNTFTVEYYQNRFTKEEGEFFNLCSQLYFHGYLNEREDGFCKYIIVDVAKFMMWQKGRPIETRDTYNSKANFLFVNYARLPKELLVVDHRQEVR